LGGGTGWLARRYGYASDSLVAAEVVTGDGRLLRVTEKEYADLFWALRGGGGNFGAVTAMEFRLFPIAQVYGGSLYFPIERAVEVFGAYAVWTRTLPDSMTSTICIQHVPEAPFFPAPVRGRSFVVIQGCLIGDEAAGTGMLETLRALGPVMDDFAMMPFREIGRIAKEPELALWAHTGTESLTELTPELIRNIVDVAGDRSQTSLTIIAVRHLDGAYAKRSESVSAATRPDTPFVMVSVGIAWSPEMRNQIVSDTAGLMEVCRPHRSGAPLLNFIGWSGRDRADDGELFSNEKAWLLATVKKRYDPGNLFRFGMPIAIPEAAAA
jgi:FAD/FMN-containing dehydrogenase